MGVFKRWIKNNDGSKTQVWYIRYTANGKDKWESIGKVGVVTKDVARARLEDRRRQVRLGQLEMIGVKVPTLSEFAEEYIRHIRDIKGNRSWMSALHYLKHLKGFFEDKKLSQITSKHVDDYKLKRLQEVKPATVNRELACLSYIFNLAKRQKEFFGNNPVSESKLLPENNQVERILTPEEEERLLNYSSPYLRPILICALNTGMRKGEILTLKWSNVDLEINVITLEHTNTKNKKMRRIPISSTLRKTFLEQRLKSGGSEYVFLSSNGKPYKRHDSLKQAFEGACRRAGIKGLRFHDLRHTAATRMVEEGVGIDKVSKILGHSSLNMTMRYSHPEDSLKDAVEKLGNYSLNRSNFRSSEKSEE
ncbi:MAG: tyrosine-type recombinase/integrase [Ignavibacteriales bacterium]